MTETTLTDAEVRRDRHLRKIALIDDLRDAIADLEQLDVRIDGDEDHPAEMAMVYIADEIEAVAKRLVELSQE